MEAAEALKELTEISSQIEAACVLDAEGNLLGSTLPDEATARRFAGTAAALLREARKAGGERELAQLEAATSNGSVFLVLEGVRAVAAVTKPEPTVGLVFYDLKSCLRAAAAPGDEDGKPRPMARPKETSESAA